MQYLEIFHNHIDKDFCKHIIQKFELDNRVKPGVSGFGYKPDLKKSYDLYLNHKATPDWNNEMNYLYNKLEPSIDMYLQKHYYPYTKGLYKPYDSGLQIQRSSAGDKFSYDWHSDDFFEYDKNNNEIGYRIITFIWYLNDISECGETEFYEGTKIKPEEGKLILFPSTWDYNHKGHVPKYGNKYICTGWFYNKIKVDK